MEIGGIAIKNLIVCVAIVVAAAGLVAGCSDAAPTPEDLFSDRADASVAMAGRIDALAITPIASMPTSGTATYNGYAALLLDTGGFGTSLLGDAVMTARFDNARFSATLNNFEGDSNLGGWQTYSGALRAEGDIGLERPNGFEGTVEGALTGSNSLEIYAIGLISGDFQGNGGQAISAQTDPSAYAYIGGSSTVGALVSIIGEQ